MKQLDFDDGKWITEGVWPLGVRSPEGHFTIGNCIPPLFHRYAKIYHPFEIDGSPATWRSMAEKWGIDFTNTSDIPQFFRAMKRAGGDRNSFPVEGEMPLPLLQQLLDLLELFTIGGKVHIFQTPPSTLFINPNGDALIETDFKEVLTYFPKYFVGYLYASDKSWIIFTDTDQHFTLFGGSDQVAHALSNSSLEVLSCNSTTRISHLEPLRGEDFD